MTSYLRSWLTGAPLAEAHSGTPEILRVSPPPSDDSGDDTETEETSRDDDDAPPAFPSPFSAQRISSPSSLSPNAVPRVLTDAQMMPPPPAPQLASRNPGTSSLAVPPTTTKRPAKPSKKSGKVALAPGHSPLDWAALKSSGEDLRVSARLVCSCFYIDRLACCS